MLYKVHLRVNLACLLLFMGSDNLINK